jgi:uncharacterized protein YqcC (DUF446 family)
MENRKERVLAQLDKIEAEMKRIGFWAANPPDLKKEVAEGRLKSFLDAPTFELWLQCLFLPNAREWARAGAAPKQSQVAQMARRQYDYHSRVEEALPLLELLDEFDDLANAA